MEFTATASVENVTSYIAVGLNAMVGMSVGTAVETSLVDIL